MKDMRWACGITGHGHDGLVYTCKSNEKTARGRGRAWDQQSSILGLSPGFMINLQSLRASVSPSMKPNLDSLI